MKVYTYSQARQQLATLLVEAHIDGEVAIKKRNGQTFILRPMQQKKNSPLDVEGVNLDIRLEDINQQLEIAGSDKKRLIFY